MLKSISSGPVFGFNIGDLSDQSCRLHGNFGGNEFSKCRWIDNHNISGVTGSIQCCGSRRLIFVGSGSASVVVVVVEIFGSLWSWREGILLLVGRVRVTGNEWKEA